MCINTYKTVMASLTGATGEEHKVKQPNLSVNLPSIDSGHLARSV